MPMLAELRPARSLQTMHALDRYTSISHHACTRRRDGTMPALDQRPEGLACPPMPRSPAAIARRAPCGIGWLFLAMPAMQALEVPAAAWAVARRHADGDVVEVRLPGQHQALAHQRMPGTVLALHPAPSGDHLIIAVRRDEVTELHRWRLSQTTTERVAWPVGTGLVSAQPAPDGSWIGIAHTRSGPLTTMGCALVVAQADGSGLRRLAMDLFGATDPTVLDDGRLVYSRWHGSTGDPTATAGLVALNPDGTNAMGLVDGPPGGALLQARGVPGSGILMAIATASPTATAGVLVRCDPARGPRYAAAVHPLAKGTTGAGYYRHPWPLHAAACVAAWSPTGHAPWTIVTLTAQQRVPLWDDGADLDLPVPLAARPAPLQRPSLVDWRVPHGWIYVQDLQVAGLLGHHPPGTATGLRIRTFRAETHTDGSTRWSPVILGTAPVAADGSVFVRVPARMPIAFDVIDTHGAVLVGMHRWTTVQRGERVSCLSCHAEPTQTPRRGGAAAFREPPAEMPPPHDLPPAAQGQEAWIRSEHQRLQDFILTLLGAP